MDITDLFALTTESKVPRYEKFCHINNDIIRKTFQLEKIRGGKEN